MVRSAKSTPSPRRALTLCRYVVSGLFHSPHRGTFHLSLTVLVHYRSTGVFSLGSVSKLTLVGLPGSDRIPRAPPYSGIQTNKMHECFVYATLTLYGQAFQPSSTTQHSACSVLTIVCTLQPQTRRSGLDCSLFARHYSGNMNIFFTLASSQ